MKLISLLFGRYLCLGLLLPPPTFDPNCYNLIYEVLSYKSVDLFCIFDIFK